MDLLKNKFKSLVQDAIDAYNNKEISLDVFTKTIETLNFLIAMYENTYKNN